MVSAKKDRDLRFWEVQFGGVNQSFVGGECTCYVCNNISNVLQAIDCLKTHLDGRNIIAGNQGRRCKVNRHDEC